MIASETLFIIGDLRIIVNPCAANPSAVHPDTEPKRHAAAAGNTPGPVPVSYTHLRAHETGRNLVCRLLLEKKKKKYEMCRLKK